VDQHTAENPARGAITKMNWYEQARNDLTRSQVLISVRLSELLFTPSSVFLHSVWFVAWFILGLDINLLTLIVSLEAIYITLFIGVGQKLQDKQAALQAAADKKVAEKAEAHREHLAEGEQQLLEVNTDLTRQIAKLTNEIHHRLGITDQPVDARSSTPE
jgi:uncharacterized membrane protein